ncbi:hypothetical protein [Streptomyces sp. NPDC002276]
MAITTQAAVPRNGASPSPLPLARHDSRTTADLPATARPRAHPDTAAADPHTGPVVHRRALPPIRPEPASDSVDTRMRGF